MSPTHQINIGSGSKYRSSNGICLNISLPDTLISHIRHKEHFWSLLEERKKVGDYI